jgi:tRNA threonylcarbamoyladenosine biosynthesis protein TsaE
MKKYFDTEADMFSYVKKIAESIEHGAVIYLSGQLGAGKTTFVRGFLRALGYQDKVKSPTFTLVEVYELADKLIYHFDLYRIENAAELENIGIRDYFSSDAVCLIEWPEKGVPVLPVPDLTCAITIADQGRDMVITASTERGEDIIKHLALSS